MPPLKVQYAPGSQASCKNAKCKQKILKGELRIGIGASNHFGDGDDLVWGYRHLCCFTAIQIKNAKKDEKTVSDIEGYDELQKEDKNLVKQLLKGDLVDKKKLIGKTGKLAGDSDDDSDDDSDESSDESSDSSTESSDSSSSSDKKKKRRKPAKKPAKKPKK